MSAKTFNTRFQLKYDTYENWSDKDKQFKLLQGEIAIVYIPETAGVDGVLHEPAVLFKVGDGTNTFNQLPFVSALAGDVPKWAKATETANGEKIADDAFVTVLEEIEIIKAFLTEGDGDNTTSIIDRIVLLEETVKNQETLITETIDQSLAEYNTRLETIENDYLVEADKDEIYEGMQRINETAAAAKNRIDTFLDTQGVADVVDSLHDIKTWMDGDGVNVTELTTAISNESTLRQEQIQTAKEELNETINTAKSDVANYADRQIESASLNSKNYTDTLITNLNNNLSAVATSGYIDDLIQKEEYVIFNCGSATLLISDPVSINTPGETVE